MSDFKSKLAFCGANIETGMKRFRNNEAMYMRVIKLFPKDESYSGLLRHIEAGEYKQAQEAAHTLKGVCGNLSLDSLYDTAALIHEGLRNQNIEEVNNYLPILKKQYSALVDVINEYENI